LGFTCRGRGLVAQIQVIKHRIRSIGNTKQITKAMELVSASKLRRAQEASIRSRTYTSSARAILQRLAGLADASHHPLFGVRQGNRRLVIVFSSDQTLAGAYNSNVERQLIDLLEGADAGSKVIAVGNQGAKFAARLNQIDLVGAYERWPVRPTSVDVRPIAETAIELFLQNQVDVVDVIYTHFFSSLTQTVQVEQLLPAIIDDVEANSGAEALNEAVFEPSPAEVLEAMMPRLIDAQILGAALSAAASEHSMRMIAMKNATDNASDIIEDLTLEYNSARQAGITQELAEITGGAEAMA
jgi:F-type H+-transporting ATPase subunit gamma